MSPVCRPDNLLFTLKKKRRIIDILEYVQWTMEILEILSLSDYSRTLLAYVFL